MSTVLNPSQQQAVDIRGRNVLVFASAGGGKTTVLVERLMKRIINDRIPLDRIVAMTFTEAAAVNMSKKLEKSLRNELALHPDDAYIMHQLALLPTAHISTIHSFCLDILKEFYYLIGLKKSSTSNILGDGQRTLLMDEAIDWVLENEDVHSLFSLYNRHNPYSDIKNDIKIILSKAEAAPDPLAWFKQVQHNTISSINELPQIYADLYMNALKNDLRKALSLSKALSEYPLKCSDLYKPLAESIDTLLSEDDLSAFLMHAPSVMTVLPPYKKPDKNTQEDEPIVNAFKETRKQLGNAFDKCANRLMGIGEVVSGYNRSLPYEQIFLNLAKKSYIRFQALKEETGVIDFGDFEHFAHAILNTNDQKVAHILQNRYAEIMVDEFQDTSEAQWSIISTISNHNLFLVGDIKQSIYRFRNAKPSIMESLKSREDFAKIHIQQNYRSKQNVVAFNNELFSQLMNLEKPQFSNEDAQITELPGQKENQVPVRFVEAYAPTDSNAQAIRLVRALALAAEIEKDHKNGTAYKDMAVLIRAHSENKELRTVFDALNIPYFIKDNEGYFKSKSTDVLLSVFKLLADPQDRLALIGVLSSPIYRLNDDELVRCREPFKLQPFADDYRKLKALADDNRLFEVVSSIYALNHFYDHLPKEEKNNLDYFINNFDSYGFTSVNAMINFIENTKEAQKESAMGLAEDAPVVKVMTIHKSKGLEFDTVYLMSKHSSSEESKEHILADEEMGLGFAIDIDEYGGTRSTVIHEAIKQKNREEDIYEYGRFLYVALTRACRRLTVIDAYEKEPSYAQKEDLLRSGGGFSSYFAVLMGQSPLMKNEKVYPEPVLPSVPHKQAQRRILPHKDYPLIETVHIAPSSLENHELSLNLNTIYGMDYGTRIHHVFEMIDYCMPVTRESLLGIDASLNEKEIHSILTFANSSIIRSLDPADIAQEYSFYYRESGKVMHGFMDFVALGEEVLLIDYKTDSGIEEDEFRLRYTPQIQGYVRVLQKMQPGKNVKALLYSVDKEAFIEIKVPE